MRQIDFIFILLFSITGLAGQGLVFDDSSYYKVPRISTYGDGSKSENMSLNNIFKVDLKPFCPDIQHQGTMGSCVGWSVGYGAYTIQNAIFNNWKDQTGMITDNAFSAMFIFNQIKLTDCEYGARIEDGFKLLKEKGDVLSKIYDSDVSDCYREPSLEELAEANLFTILDYATLFGPEDQKGIKINKTKISLVQDRPVVVGMEIRKNFYRIRNGEQFWFPEVGNTDPGGGHAMVVVGFDEVKKAFEIMNSWGELWGNQGFIWVKYDDFAKYCKYGFQFQTRQPGSSAIINYGKVLVRKPAIRTRDTILFSEVPLSLNGYYYEPLEEDWAKGMPFQLLISDVRSGTYLYCFSLDADNELKIHWPRDERLDSSFDGLIESALISVPEVNLVIPNQYTALQINKSGAEHICLLFASEPISDFNRKIKKLLKKKGPFVEKLKYAFGKDVLTFDSIKYEKNTAQFAGQTISGQVVPLILKIEVD